MDILNSCRRLDRFGYLGFLGYLGCLGFLGCLDRFGFWNRFSGLLGRVFIVLRRVSILARGRGVRHSCYLITLTHDGNNVPW